MYLTHPQLSVYKRGKHINYTLFNCKHLLNFACLTHKGGATEVTKIWLNQNLFYSVWSDSHKSKSLGMLLGMRLWLLVSSALLFALHHLSTSMFHCRCGKKREGYERSSYCSGTTSLIPRLISSFRASLGTRLRHYHVSSSLGMPNLHLALATSPHN